MRFKFLANEGSYQD